MHADAPKAGKAPPNFAAMANMWAPSNRNAAYIDRGRFFTCVSGSRVINVALSSRRTHSACAKDGGPAMTAKNLLIGGCGAAAFLVLAPSLASAAVQFDNVYLSSTSSASATGATTQSQTVSQTYTSLASGVSEDASSIASSTKGNSSSQSDTSATLSNASNGSFDINESLNTSTTSAGTATTNAHASAGEQAAYTFNSTKPFDITLTGDLYGHTGSQTTGSVEVLLEDLTTSSTVYSSILQATSTGSFLSQVLNNLASGQYELSFNNVTDPSSSVTGKSKSDFVADNGELSFAIAGVPEPATWAMMLLGVGGIGAVMRRRRRFATGVVAA